jgi:hypothetical protein
MVVERIGEDVGWEQWSEERWDSLSSKEPSYLLSVLGLQKDVEALADACVREEAEAIQRTQDEIRALHELQSAARRRHASEVAAVQTWNAWSTVAQFIGTAGTVALGASVVSAAPWAGGLLIGSGVAGLANRVLGELGIWYKAAGLWTDDPERQSALASSLDTGVAMLSLGLGAAGAGLAYGAGAFVAIGHEAWGEGIAKVMGVAGGALGTSARLGGALAEKHALEAQAELKKIESGLFEKREERTRSMRDLQEMLRLTAEVAEEARRCVEFSEVHG